MPRWPARLALLALLAPTIVLSPSPARADGDFSLGIAVLSDLLVDESHEQLLIAGTTYSPGTSGTLLKHDLDGRPVAQLTGLPLLGGLAESADGTTLYAALRGADAIATIDVATFTQTGTISTGASTCPGSLAMAGGLLWFGYGCASQPAGLGSLDPAVGASSVQLDRVPGLTSAPRLTSSGPAANKLIVSTDSVRLVDVSGAPTVTATVAAASAPNAVALSPDGARLVVAAIAGSSFPSYSTSDLTPQVSYGTSLPAPVAAAAGAGFVLTGNIDSQGPDLRLFTAAGELLRSWEMDGADGTGGGRIEGDGVAVRADLSRAYTVLMAGGQVTQLRLRVLHDVARLPSSISFDAAPAASLNQPFELTGHLAGGARPIAPFQLLEVTRVGPNGSQPIGMTSTTGDGSFVIRDQVGVRGPYTYLARWSGDDQHQATSGAITLRVKGYAAQIYLDFAPNDSVNSGTAVTVSTWLNDQRAGDVISLYAKPYGKTKTLLKTYTATSADSVLTVVYRPTARTDFGVTFGGNSTYEPASSGRALFARPVISVTQSGYYGGTASLRLYHAKTDPVITATLPPGNAGACVYFSVQRPYSGIWANYASSSCVRVSSTNRAQVYFTGVHPTGVHFRIEVRFGGSAANLPSYGPYAHLSFTA